MPSPTHWQLEEASRGSSVQQGSLRGNPPQPCDDAERLRGTARISSCWPCPCSAPCTTPACARGSLPQNPCTESLGAAAPREGGRTPLSPPPTGAGRGLGGRGGLCRDARGVGRVPLSLPGCGAWRGRLRATRALGTQGGEG